MPEREKRMVIDTMELSLQVILPEEHVGDFIVEFGKTFASINEENHHIIKPVDEYYLLADVMWHVRVSGRMDELLGFAKKFCSERGIPFVIPPFAKERIRKGN